ncbi:hypothetical protein GWI33_008184 [Rhynchophorus ferrugineus]|uniref:Uncharacterized protein n=1 Tax=Rhynchophorus ferrugineus TaxID=354439 RepID=A0A834IRD7_RHYFE|nr:hypothetical protein GWI33_008184 [Rhynchophorus ferrugineus]
MPRKSIVSDLQANETTVSSPLRRSSRIVSQETNTPKGVGARRNSQTDSIQKPSRSRRSSVQEVEEKPEAKPSTRTRRASILAEEEAKKEASSTPTRRGRKASVTELTEEKPKPVRGRRSSAAEPPAEPEPKPQATRGRRKSVDVTESQPTPKQSTRRKKSSESDDATETTKPVRGRRSVANEPAEKKPVVRRGRRASVEPEHVDEEKPNENNEETADMSPVIKDVSVMVTPLKKSRILDKVEADLDLSVINESDDFNNSKIETSPRNIKENTDTERYDQERIITPVSNKKRLSISPPEGSTPRKSPRLTEKQSKENTPEKAKTVSPRKSFSKQLEQISSVPKSSSEDDLLNSSNDSISSNKENMKGRNSTEDINFEQSMTDMLFNIDKESNRSNKSTMDDTDGDDNNFIIKETVDSVDFSMKPKFISENVNADNSLKTGTLEDISNEVVKSESLKKSPIKSIEENCTENILMPENKYISVPTENEEAIIVSPVLSKRRSLLKENQEKNQNDSPVILNTSVEKRDIGKKSLSPIKHKKKLSIKSNAELENLKTSDSPKSIRSAIINRSTPSPVLMSVEAVTEGKCRIKPSNQENPTDISMASPPKKQKLSLSPDRSTDRQHTDIDEKINEVRSKPVKVDEPLSNILVSSSNSDEKPLGEECVTNENQKQLVVNVSKNNSLINSDHNQSNHQDTSKKIPSCSHVEDEQRKLNIPIEQKSSNRSPKKSATCKELNRDISLKSNSLSEIDDKVTSLRDNQVSSIDGKDTDSTYYDFNLPSEDEDINVSEDAVVNKSFESVTDDKKSPQKITRLMNQSLSDEIDNDNDDNCSNEENIKDSKIIDTSIDDMEKCNNMETSQNIGSVKGNSPTKQTTTLEKSINSSEPVVENENQVSAQHTEDRCIPPSFQSICRNALKLKESNKSSTAFNYAEERDKKDVDDISSNSKDQNESLVEHKKKRDDESINKNNEHTIQMNIMDKSDSEKSKESNKIQESNSVLENNENDITYMSAENENTLDKNIAPKENDTHQDNILESPKDTNFIVDAEKSNITSDEVMLPIADCEEIENKRKPSDDNSDESDDIEFKLPGPSEIKLSDRKKINSENLSNNTEEERNDHLNTFSSNEICDISDEEIDSDGSSNIKGKEEKEKIPCHSDKKENSLIRYNLDSDENSNTEVKNASLCSAKEGKKLKATEIELSNREKVDSYKDEDNFGIKLHSDEKSDIELRKSPQSKVEEREKLQTPIKKLYYEDIDSDENEDNLAVKDDSVSDQKSDIELRKASQSKVEEGKKSLTPVKNVSYYEPIDSDEDQDNYAIKHHYDEKTDIEAGKSSPFKAEEKRESRTPVNELSSDEEIDSDENLSNSAIKHDSDEVERKKSQPLERRLSSNQEVDLDKNQDDLFIKHNSDSDEKSDTEIKKSSKCKEKRKTSLPASKEKLLNNKENSDEKEYNSSILGHSNTDEESCGIEAKQPLSSSKKLSNVNSKLDDYINDQVIQSGDSDSDVEAEEMPYTSNDFIDDMAEEGEEDTPSEDSNQIIIEGESIGPTDSEEQETDDEYSDLSFICDDETDELLSGEEYDLGNEKKPKKKSRIINSDDLPDDEIIKIQKNKKEKPQKKSRIFKYSLSSDDDELEDFRSKVLKDETNIDECAENNGAIEVEDLSQIQELQQSDNKKHVDVKQTGESDNKKDSETSINEPSTQAPLVKRDRQKGRRKSSLSIQENIVISGSGDPNISKRIHSLVDSFCSSVSKGEIALNISLEFEDNSKSPPHTSLAITEDKVEKQVKEEERRSPCRSDKKSSNDFVDGKTEEGHGDSPSEDSNQILDEGESIGSTEEQKADSEYENDSFSCDEEEVSSGNTLSDASYVSQDTQKLNVSIDTVNEITDLREVLERKANKRRMSRSMDDISKNIESSKKTKTSTKSVPKIELNKKQKKKKGGSKTIKDPCTSSFGLINQLISDVKNRPKRIVKPSQREEGVSSSWVTSKVKDLKPSTSPVSKKERIKIKPNVHPKDFKNQMLSSSSRVKRINTTTLLKKKGVFN